MRYIVKDLSPWSRVVRAAQRAHQWDAATVVSQQEQRENICFLPKHMSMVYRMSNGGKHISTAQHFPKYNPANGELLAEVPQATPEQVDSAVAAAQAAFETFSCTKKEERHPTLLACSEIITNRFAELSELLCKEQGKPISSAQEEVEWAADCFKRATSISIPTKVLYSDEDYRVEVRHRPVGPVAVIVPWNFPLGIAAFQAARAMAFGNPVIIKPSPQTPITALRLGEILGDIVPPGVIQVVTGSDSPGEFNVGDYLVRHSGIRKVSFTGSVKTGKSVLASSVNDLTRCTLELGGNDPAIVLADADITQVVTPILRAAFMNSGQVCSAIKRIYVHASLYEKFVEAASIEVKKLSSLVGDGMDPNVKYGPINNEMQYNRVRELVADAISHGGCVVQGELHANLPKNGFFMAPAIVTGITDGVRLVDEEQFGPVVPIMKYTDESEVISRANGTPYGLSASVWGSDSTMLNRVAEQILAGVVHINSHGPRGDYDEPGGGFKDSGLGREGDYSDADLIAYTEMQTITVATG